MRSAVCGDEGAQGRGEKLRLCLREPPQREQQPARQPRGNTNPCAVLSDSCKCKRMHYLQDTSKAISPSSPPFPPLCWGGPCVSLRLRIGAGCSAGLEEAAVGQQEPIFW